MRNLIILIGMLFIMAPFVAAQNQGEENKVTKNQASPNKDKAGRLKIEPGQRYLVVETMKTSTMQKELDEAAAQGFRIVFGAPTATNEMAILLERIPEDVKPYQYKLLATTRTSTMEKEINDIAREGFRLLPRTIISKDQLLGTIEAILVMEGAATPDKHYEYKLFSTQSTSKLQKEVVEAETQGYTVTGMVSRGTHMVILEKETPVKN